MGLRAVVRSAVVTVFKAIGDIARPATYTSVTGIIRDLEAGTSAPQGTDYVLTRTVFTKFTEKEVDSAVVVETDQKFLFPALDLPVEPKASDLITDEHGQIWEIVRRLSDPASALVKLQVRSSR